LDGKCCKKCERGFVKNITCPTDIREHCVQCEAGEYIDHTNDLDECWRCILCDEKFGLEIARNCTPEQNTECTCAKNYFCSSSEPCTHCEPCSTCESGLVEKQCTSTSDTVCKRKDVILLFLESKGEYTLCWILKLFCCIVSDKRKSKDPTSGQSPVVRYQCQEFSFPIMLLDIDLSTHIPGIVGEMTLQDVKTFVRDRQVPEPVIDQILRDNCNDTSEQKIKLFQVWYQRHGMKGAYGTLINSLRALKMCTAADKIEEKLKAAVPSSQESGQSYNDDNEQSTTCTQEGGNSYLGNAELSKTYSNSLEET
ncbi:Tumor necrosis factor receptor superfamily member 6, partial [Struthio camelus australis]